MPRTITTPRSYRQTFDARSGRLAANGSHDVLVREDVTRMPLEDDLAAVDRIEAIGDARGIDEIGLGDQHRDPHRLDGRDRLDEAADDDRRQTLERLVQQQHGGREPPGTREPDPILLTAAPIEPPPRHQNPPPG